MRFAQFFKQYFSRFLVSLSVFLSSCPPVFAGDGGSLRTFWDHVCGLALIGAVIVTTLFYIAEYKFLDTFFPTRYKITATVEVNGQLYQGSAVQQYYCYEPAKWIQMLDHGQCLLTHGEAVVVDLKERGMLFLTLEGPGWDQYSLIVSIFMARGQNPFEHKFQNSAEKWILTPKDMPMMVTFGNIHDARTVKAVDPKNLAASFGEGVHLKSVEVEETGEWVTWGKIYEILPWLRTKKVLFDSKFQDSAPGFIRQLGKIDFIYGE